MHDQTLNLVSDAEAFMLQACLWCTRPQTYHESTNLSKYRNVNKVLATFFYLVSLKNNYRWAHSVARKVTNLGIVPWILSKLGAQGERKESCKENENFLGLGALCINLLGGPNIYTPGGCHLFAFCQTSVVDYNRLKVYSGPVEWDQSVLYRSFRSIL